MPKRIPTSINLTGEKLAATLLTARSTVPALACMHVRNGILFATNHTDTFFQMPTALADGTYDKRVQRLAQTAPFELEELRTFFGVIHDADDLALVDHAEPCSVPSVLTMHDIARVIHACDPKCERPVLRNVRVEISPEARVQYVATDGTFLAAYDNAQHYETQDLESFCVPYAAARIFAKWDKVRTDNGKTGAWYVSVSDHCVIAYEEVTGASIVSIRTDGVYPDIKRIIGDPAGTRKPLVSFIGGDSDIILPKLEPVKHHKGLVTFERSDHGDSFTNLTFTCERLAPLTVYNVPLSLWDRITDETLAKIALPAEHFLSAMHATAKRAGSIVSSSLSDTDPLVLFNDGTLIQAMLNKKPV